MMYALTISYRGDGYSGWQRQENARTVQQTVEEALTEVLDEPVRIHGASRTDAGVHARGQVAHLELAREVALGALQHGANQRLPEDIRVMAAWRMDDGFHARKCAESKEYRYRLIQGRVISPLEAPFAVRAPSDLDLSAMREATTLLPGRHDFSAFAIAGGGHRQPYRQIFRASWRRDGRRIELQIEGDGFLRGMVRSLVGTLLDVGRGRCTVERFEALLEGGRRDEAGPTAPARGLVLQAVRYPPEWGFERDPDGSDVLD